MKHVLKQMQYRLAVIYGTLSITSSWMTSWACLDLLRYRYLSVSLFLYLYKKYLYCRVNDTAEINKSQRTMTVMSWIFVVLVPSALAATAWTQGNLLLLALFIVSLCLSAVSLSFSPSLTWIFVVLDPSKRQPFVIASLYRLSLSLSLAVTARIQGNLLL